jgi:capsular exopolysaccharide synthesis family protein
MHKLLSNDSIGPAHLGPVLDTSSPGPAGATPSTTPLIEVLWRRRWAVALTVLACLVVVGIYLLVATPVYRATARVGMQEHGPRVYSEYSGYLAQSESFLQTQLDIIQSAAVLGRALEAVNYRQMRTFAGDVEDPIGTLRNGGILDVTLGRRSDVVNVSVESPHAREAATLANAVVDAYLSEQSRQRRAVGQEIVRVLEREKQQVLARRDANMRQMLKFKRDRGIVSFRDGDRANTAGGRVASLSESLTRAEVNAFEIRALKDATEDALKDPSRLSAFVEAQQFKGRDFGDREYDEMRTQLSQHLLALSTAIAVQGTNSPRVQAIQSTIDGLRERIRDKEQSIARSHVLSLTSQLNAAEANIQQLRAALDAGQGAALDLTPEAAEYARLEGESDRLSKQLEVIEHRVAEVSVNQVEAGPTGIRVLEPARVESRPVRPKKGLALTAAMLVGWVLGVGVALLLEWQDARLRRPEEILTFLGTPVIAMVPRTNPRLSPVTRGQLVRLDARCAAAEAYRSVRTTLHLGPGAGAKTILVASPAAGDGKSTTASNLAIAFAQAGERTLLIDCDLRNPVQHMIFEVDGNVGLSSVMSGEAKIGQAVAPTSASGLYLLPCGPVPGNPSELLTSKRFGRLMQALSGTFDRIVIDSPPLMSVTDGRILAAGADVTLLVLRMNRSARQLGLLALDGLRRVGANVLGAVANDVPAHIAPQQHYGDAWNYAVETRRLLALGAATRSRSGTAQAASNGNGAARESAGGNGQLAEAAVNANGEHAPASNGQAPEVLTIAEPDWSADKP